MRPDESLRAFRLSAVIGVAAILVTVGSASRASAQGKLPRLTPAASNTSVVKPYVLLDKPRPTYTDTARENRVEGTVKLRVTLLASGEVGEIAVLQHLPHGLTDRAIDAARKIKFKPKLIKGEPVDVTTTVDYRFNLYYNNDDTEIRSKAEVIGKPRPELSEEQLAQLRGKKVLVEVFFGANERTSVFRFLSDLPLDIREKMTDAVEQITFRPAVYSDGRKMSVTKVVEYDF
jgi:TonB family protein